MTILYRPTDALAPKDRKVPGILITQYPRAMYLVPIEAEEGTDTIETGEGHFYTRTRFVTPWEEA